MKSMDRCRFYLISPVEIVCLVLKIIEFCHVEDKAEMRLWQALKHSRSNFRLAFAEPDRSSKLPRLSELFLRQDVLRIRIASDEAIGKSSVYFDTGNHLSLILKFINSGFLRVGSLMKLCIILIENSQNTVLQT